MVQDQSTGRGAEPEFSTGGKAGGSVKSMVFYPKQRIKYPSGKEVIGFITFVV
ncbi:hypothetical protein SAMN02927921_00434 [Sinomicrobium oceani]|uniref:Uncharacterized protein n=1 Tax=Sinomicrobium oceani TaxID=1150368 RepID=A0A1K1M6Y0_9FLAO|nr:hypothetical protein SAMN02927921_00434 [Sinomicrobium oceani]